MAEIGNFWAKFDVHIYLGLRNNNFKKFHKKVKYYSLRNNVRHKRAEDALKNKNLALHKSY